MVRFLSHDAFEPHLDALFGCPDWRDAIGMTAAEKPPFLRALYQQQLAAIGMDYVRSFELRVEGSHTEYFLTFGTHSLEGLKAMKDAMWNVDPTGGAQFSDATDPLQQTLFSTEPDFGELELQIRTRLAGSTVTTDAIERFVLVETAFRETHYKKQILRPREMDGSIQVERPAGRTKGWWGDGTTITFP